MTQLRLADGRGNTADEFTASTPSRQPQLVDIPSLTSYLTAPRRPCAVDRAHIFRARARQDSKNMSPCNKSLCPRGI